MRGTPRYIYDGIQDLSILPTILEREENGQHLPIFVIQASKGTYDEQTMSGAEALSYYGIETFNKKDKFFNHQTMFLKGAMAHGKVVIKRINMGGTGARATHYIDILRENRDIPARTPNGAIDLSSDPMFTDIECLKIRHVVEYTGAIQIKDGTMKDADGNKSTMYPIFSFDTLDGSAYNDFGYSIKPNPRMDSDDISAYGQFIYDFELRVKKFGLIKTIKTLEMSTPTFKFGMFDGIDPLTETEISLAEKFDAQYYNEEDYSKPWRYRDLNIKVFEDNIDRIVSELANVEGQFVNDHEIKDNGDVPVVLTDWFDLNGSLDEYMRKASQLNFMDLHSTKRVPYFTVIVDPDYSYDSGDGARPIIGNVNSTFFLNGGTDMAMNLTVDQPYIKADPDNNVEGQPFITAQDLQINYYNGQVKLLLGRYLDVNSEKQEIAFSPESTIWDSGFPLDVKYELANIIAVRGDTGVILSTYIVNPEGDAYMDLEDEVAIGVLLKNRLLLTPESTFYGTSVGRAIICAGSCIAVSSDYKGRIPTTYDLLIKVCKYMGAGNKKWKPSEQFDAGDESAALEITSILPKFAPPSIKGKLWSTGINWVEPLYSKTVYHWPAFATVADDNSVRNSIFTMFGAMEICRVEVLAWKMFTGESRYSEGTFKEKIENFVSDNLRGKFDGRFTLFPSVTITDVDRALGYRWRLNTRMGVNNMYTVVRNSITIERK